MAPMWDNGEFTTVRHWVNTCFSLYHVIFGFFLLDDILVYPGSIHGVSTWRYPDQGSTFGSVYGPRWLDGCPYGSRIPRRLHVERCAWVICCSKKNLSSHQCGINKLNRISIFDKYSNLMMSIDLLCFFLSTVDDIFLKNVIQNKTTIYVGTPWINIDTSYLHFLYTSLCSNFFNF